MEILKNTNKVTTIGVFNLDIQTQKMHWNSALHTIFQISEETAPTLESFLSYIKSPEEQLEIKKIFTNACKTEQTFKAEYEIITAKNNLYSVQIFGHSIFKNGKCIYIQGNIVKLKQLEESEQKLDNLKKQLHTAEVLAKSGSWNWNLVTNKLIWSDNLYSIFNLNKNTTVTYEIYIDFIYEKDKKYVNNNIELALQNKKYIDSTYRIQLKNGTIKNLKSVGKVITNEQGDVINIIGTCQDITEVYKKEQELSEAKELLNFSEELTDIGYWRYKPEVDYVFWSENLYQIFDHPKEENLSFLSYFKTIHPEDQEFVKEKIEASIKDQKFYDFTHRVISKNGSIKTIQIIGKVLTNKNDGLVELLGLSLDITKSESRELEITTKNQQLSIAEKLAMIGYWNLNTITNEIVWSDNLYKIYDQKKSEPLTFKGYLDYIHKEDKQFVTNNIKETLKDKIFKDSTYRIVLKNGTIKTLKSIGKVFTDRTGKIIEIMGICQDITNSIANENEILQKNKQLNQAEILSKTGSWVFKPKTEEFECSDNLYRINGLEIGSKINFDIFLSSVHPDDINEIKKLHKEIYEQKKFSKIRYRVIHKNETIRDIETFGNVITNNQGEIIEIIGTSKDITETKQNEEELLRKNQQLNRAEQLAKIGSWVLRPKIGEFIWSKNLYEIYGFEVGTVMDFDKFMTCIHPDDIERLGKQISDTFETKVFQNITYKINHKDGSTKIIDAVGFVVTDEHGEIIEILGTSRDVTEQVKTQEKILEINTNLEESTHKLTTRNRQLADFNHITSHNLRAPVSNLNALLELWKNTDNIDLKEQLFGKFEIVIKHLTVTLSSLIESLKVTNNQDVVIEELHFENVLHKTQEILAAEIIKTGTIIKSNFSKKVTLSYNQIYLESIFLNLISNAIKYKSPERTPEIEIESDLIDGKTYLSVKDNGLGIDLKKHGHKLFGLNKVFHKHPEANGIGLFMTKAQIEAMGGSISADSQVNVGTTFFITFN